MDEDDDPAFGGGAEFRWNKNSQEGTSLFRLEGFYTQKTLPSRKAQSWFSASPPLPERDFRFYALGTVFTTPAFGIASDWAFSETFAFGRDIYGNVAVRLGNRPWRISLAADGAGNRFVGRDGAAVKEGFRLGGRLERLGVGSGLFRFSGDFRGPAAGKAFEQGFLELYFRPPAPSAKKAARFRGLSRVSLSLDRDERDPVKTEDTVKGTADFKLGPIGANFSGAYSAVPQVFGDFISAKVSGEITWSPGIFQFRAKLGYTAAKDKESVWDTSLYGAARLGKQNRLSVKIAASNFPRDWNYTISWRLNYSN
jgi:hypothetical protein